MLWQTPGMFADDVRAFLLITGILVGGIAAACLVFLAVAAPQSSTIHLMAIVVGAPVVLWVVRSLLKLLGNIVDSDARCAKREEERRRKLGYS